MVEKFTARRFPGRPAFTLIEVMIAVALALLVALGVHRIFQISADTISTGQAISEGVRAEKALLSSLSLDFVGYPDGTSGIVPAKDMPFLMICNSQTMAFRDPADQRANPGKKTLHRTDIVSFFSQAQFSFSTGAFKRLTGQNVNGLETFTSDTTAPEAYIWWGIVNTPDLNGNYCPPGTDTRANTFANDWVLGRVAILLRARDANPPAAIWSNGVAQVFAQDTDFPLAPLDWRSLVKEPVSNSDFGTLGRALYRPGGADRAHYDLAGITVPPAQASDTPLKVYRGKVAQAQVDNLNWWKGICPDDGTFYRFDCNPVFARPPNSGKLSMQAPYFMGGCANFIVEFAGDFVKQAKEGDASYAFGEKTDSIPDGIVDYLVKDISIPYQDGNGKWTTATQKIREIRWYGAKRDPGGDGTFAVDTVSAFRNSGGNVGPEPFEKVDASGQYVCIWGPNELTSVKPALIRITVQWNDRGGRLVDGLTREYIFKVR